MSCDTRILNCCILFFSLNFNFGFWNMAKTRANKKHPKRRSSPIKQVGNVMVLQDRKVQKPRIKTVSWSEY